MRTSAITFGLVAAVVLLLFVPLMRGRDELRPGVPETEIAAPAPDPPIAVLMDRGQALPRLAEDLATGSFRSLKAALDEALPPGLSSEERAERLLLRGLAAESLGDAEGAVAALAPAARHFAEAGPESATLAWLALSRLAAAQRAQEAPELGLEALTRAVALAPEPFVERSRISLAEALLDAGRANEAVEALSAQGPRGPRSAAQLGLLLRAAQGGASLPPAELVAFRAELGWAHPAHPQALALGEDPAWKAVLEAARREGRFEALIRRAEALVVADQGRLASSELEELLKAEPPREVEDEARVLLGRALRVRKQHARALAQFEKVSGSDSELACRAAYNAALSAKLLRRRGDERRHLERAAAGPPCEWRDRAVERLAEKQLAAGEREAARELLLLASHAATSEGRRAEAAWRRAWSLVEDGEADEARRALTELPEKHPRSREASAALFWLARLEREGSEPSRSDALLAELLERFPLDYHALLAAEELGREAPLPRPAGPDEAREFLASAFGALERQDAAARAARLWRLGLPSLAFEEYEAAGGEDWGVDVVLLGEAGRHREALVSLRRAAPDWRCRNDFPPAVWEAAYPRAHSDLVERYSSEVGLEPALVYALIHQESVFDPRARSVAGARGLMQIMPGTGRTIARWFKERSRAADLLDPELNVRYGTAYLKRLLDDLGHQELALAGYNAGGTRARRWWAKLPEKDLALFVESIPFDETRDYVKAVTWNRSYYEAAERQRAAARALRDEEAAPSRALGP